jgi:putative DNA primase/helicase
MDYLTIFQTMGIAGSSDFPRTDIGVSSLFYCLHQDFIRYVKEPKSWYVWSGKLWVKDEGGFNVMEMCKGFTQNYAVYAEAVSDGSEDGKAYVKFGKSLTNRRKREGILSDARSIEPMSLADFDSNKNLFNCQNGTYNLANMTLQPHNISDFITKIAKVKYDSGAVCERWDSFISEVMSGDTDAARYLQKAFGYALSGETLLECFFILYGSTTRNGKTTLTETIAAIMGDYARTIQPQSLSRRSRDGAAASPDIARLKGARLVNMPEPGSGLELNIALVKQFTGGNSVTARFLNENPVEFKPECKLFINTNHLPGVADETIFSSGRLKVIPFNRHFDEEEQDKSLKRLFRKSANKSAALNWLIAGYRLLMAEGLTDTARVRAAIDEYRQESDIIGTFLIECTAQKDNYRQPADDVHAAYVTWAKDSGVESLGRGKFYADLRRRGFKVARDKRGVVINGLILDISSNPFTEKSKPA